MPSDELADARALLRQADELRDRGSRQEAIQAYEAAADRYGGAADAEVREVAADAWVRGAYQLGLVGDHDAEDATYGRVVSNFGQDDLFGIQWDVALALFNRACSRWARGDLGAALAGFDEIVWRYGQSEKRGLRNWVAQALSGKASRLATLNQHDEAVVVWTGAIAAIDRLLVDPGDLSVAELRERAIAARIERGWSLGGLGRETDAVGDYEAALGVAGSPPDARFRPLVLDALARKLAALCRADDYEAASRVPARLAAVFADVQPERGHAAEADWAWDDGADATLAQLLAETYASDCWEHFLRPAVGRPHDELAQRAVAIFRETAPVLETLTDEDEGDTPRVGAAFLLRSIASGFALLSQPGPLADEEWIKLPIRAQVDHAIRTTGLDHWAEDHGHALSLDDSPMIEREELDAESPRTASNFPVALLDTLLIFELVEAIRSSPTAALGLEGLRRRAVSLISWTSSWTVSIGLRRPEAAPAAMAMWLFAHAYFVATWSPAPRDEWFPSRAFMHELIAEAEIRDWLEQARVELPVWAQ